MSPVIGGNPIKDPLRLPCHGRSRIENPHIRTGRNGNLLLQEREMSAAQDYYIRPLRSHPVHIAADQPGRCLSFLDCFHKAPAYDFHYLDIRGEAHDSIPVKPASESIGRGEHTKGTGNA